MSSDFVFRSSMYHRQNEESGHAKDIRGKPAPENNDSSTMEIQPSSPSMLASSLMDFAPSTPTSTTPSPIASPSSPSSELSVTQRTKFKQNAETLRTALQKVDEIERMARGFNLTSIQTLRKELNSLIDFHKFLLTMNVSDSDLGYFSILPSEVIISILSFLDAYDLSRICAVCTAFQTWGEDERLWQAFCIRKNLPLSHKPLCKSWKWLSKSKLNVLKEKDNKDAVGICRLSTESKSPQEHEYSGDWKQNKKHGWGTSVWSNGSTYTGEWKDDTREGWGTRTWQNGNKYCGQYKGGKRHGEGEFSFSNGSVFKGRFEDNKFVYGTYTWPNGRVYNGEWDNILRHGNGAYWWPDGRSYIGEWKNDKRHGRGVYSWPNKDSYEGNFIDGRRVGKGVLRLASGEVYDQEWNEEVFDENNKGLPAEGQSDADVLTTSVVVSKKRKHSPDTIDEDADKDDDEHNKAKHLKS